MKLKAFIVLMLSMILVSACTPQKVKPYDLKDIKDGETIERNVHLTLNNNSLFIEPDSIVIDLGDYGLKLNLAEILPDAILYSVDNYGSTAYVRLTDEAQLTGYELMLSYSIPEEVDIGKMKPIKDNSNIIAYDDSGYSAGMAKLEMGQLYIAISGEEANQDNVAALLMQAVDKIYKFEKPKESSINTIINFDTLGSIDFSKIEELQGKSGFYYSITDNILRLYNETDDIPYVFIANIDNPLLNNTYGSLEKTEYPNVYRSKNYEDESHLGYKTFNIMAEKGMYTLKLNERSEDKLYNEILDTLNITKADEYIPIPLDAQTELTN